MIAEHMRHTIHSMRQLLERGNEDFLERAPFFLDSLEVDLERMADLQDASVSEDAWRSLRMHFKDVSGLEEPSR